MPFVKACYAALGSWGVCVCVCVCVCACVSLSVVSNSAIPWTVALLLLWNYLGKKTGVGSHSLLQGNLPNSGMETESLSLQAGPLPSKPPASW